jgi:hypothetical protein
VRSVVLDGATLIDIPFFGRFAVNGQRALDLVARRCAREPACARAFPSWATQLRSLIAAWNAKPVQVSPDLTLTGDELAGVIQFMTLNAASAGSIPLVVSRAARGDSAPLAGQIPSSGADNPLMFWSIWCNERWVGLDARGPWGTYLDGYAASQLERYRSACAYVPDHAEPASNLARVRSNVPVLALVGGADPQDPAANVAGLARRCRRRASSCCPSTVTASADTAACRTSSSSSSTAAAQPGSTCAACARPSHRRSSSARRQDGGAADDAAAQAVERLLRSGERERLDRRPDRMLAHRPEQVMAVAARQVCNRPEHTLAPQELVGEGRDRAHVDPGANDRAALGDRSERLGDELAGRSEDDRGVELLRPLADRAGPLGADAAGQRLRRRRRPVA